VNNFYVRATGVNLVFKDQTLNLNLNFTWQKNESIAILGANGTGKTSLLSNILGLKNNFSGRIEKNFDRCGYAPSSPALFPWLSIEENFHSLGLEIPNIAKLEFADIISKFPNEISTGQAQIMNLLRALAVKSPVIFLDEPLEHLDIKNKLLLSNHLRNEQVIRRLDLLCITHSIDEALLLADKILLLDKSGGGSHLIVNMLNQEERQHLTSIKNSKQYPVLFNEIYEKFFI
jgi:NitT/TauT family transport system ATP-binding protein